MAVVSRNAYRSMSNFLLFSGGRGRGRDDRSRDDAKGGRSSDARDHRSRYGPTTNLELADEVVPSIGKFGPTGWYTMRQMREPRSQRRQAQLHRQARIWQSKTFSFRAFCESEGHNNKHCNDHLSSPFATVLQTRKQSGTPAGRHRHCRRSRRSLRPGRCCRRNYTHRPSRPRDCCSQLGSR